MSDKKDQIEKNINLEQQNKDQNEKTTTLDQKDKDKDYKIKSEPREYQIQNNKIFQEYVNTLNQFQDRFIKTSKEISNNYIELLKTMVNMYQLYNTQMLNNPYENYWNNFMSPKKYNDEYNKMNQNISDRIAKSTKIANDIILGNIEMFNKSVEIAQKFYTDTVRNYFNYVRNIEKSFNP